MIAPILAAGAVGLLFPVLFVLAAWRGVAVRSRAELLVAGADAVVALVFIHRILDWSVVPGWAFLVPVAVVAVGVTGAVLAWPRMPAWRPGRRRRTSVVLFSVHAVVVAAVAALLLAL